MEMLAEHPEEDSDSEGIVIEKIPSLQQQSATASQGARSLKRQPSSSSSIIQEVFTSLKRHRSSSTSLFWDIAPPPESIVDAASEVAWLEAHHHEAFSESVSDNDDETGAPGSFVDHSAPSPAAGRQAIQFNKNARSRRPSILDDRYVQKYSQLVATKEIAVKGGPQINVVNPSSNGVKSEHCAESVKAEDGIKWKHLPLLEKLWKEHGSSVDRETFVQVLHDTMKPVSDSWDDFEQKMSLLFYRMDTNSDGSVDWDEFCTHLMMSLEEKFQVEHQRDYPLLVCPRNFSSPHNHAIRRMRFYGDPTNRFMSFDEAGQVCIWGIKMELLRTIQLPEMKSTGTSIQLIDAAFIACCNVFVVITSNSDVRFYDGGTEQLYKAVLIGDFPTSLSVWCSDASKQASALVAFGTMNGTVHLLKFPSATRLADMFNTYSTRFWQDPVNIKIADIEKQAPVTTGPAPVLHACYIAHEQSQMDELDGAVIKMSISADGDLVFSCSKSWKSAFVITRTNKFCDMGSSTVRVHQGVNCFDHSVEFNQVATAGKDGIVRLWNPYVTTHTQAELKGHGSAIISIQYNTVYNQLLTLCIHETIRVWDLEQMICLNALAEIIPHRMVVKHLATDMVWHTWTQSLVTIAKEEISVIQLTRDLDRRAFAVTDNQSVSCMCILQTLQFLATGSTGGTIATWKLDTGEKMQEFGEEGGVPISALCAGNLSSRMISSDVNGRVIVWNVLAGTILQILEADGPRKEVSGLVCFKNYVFAGGWSRRLHRFEAPRELVLTDCPITVTEQLENYHIEYVDDDISCLTVLQNTYVITGSFDGTIIVWDFRTGNVLQKFNSKSCISFLQKQTRWALHLPPPQEIINLSVNALLTLDYRVEACMKQGKEMAYVATLVVSSDNGTLHFYQPVIGTLLGSFRYSTKETHNDMISSLSSDDTNSVIFTGDSQGYINAFDIEAVCISHPPSKFDGIDKSPAPTLLHQWRAHAQPITALQFIDNGEYSTIASAATDGAVRLWSPNGGYLGTFGAGMLSSMGKAVQLYHTLVNEANEKTATAGHASGQSAWGSVAKKFAKKKPKRRFSQALDMFTDNAAQSHPRRSASFLPKDVITEVLRVRNAQSIRSEAVANKAMSAIQSITEKAEELKTEQEVKVALTDKSVLKQTSLEDALDELAAGKLSTKLTQLSRPESSPGWESLPVLTSRLGRHYDSKLSDRYMKKKEWRNKTPRPNTAKTMLTGTKICQPFSVLELDRCNLDEIVQPRNPLRLPPSWGSTKKSLTSLAVLTPQKSIISPVKKDSMNAGSRVSLAKGHGASNLQDCDSKIDRNSLPTQKQTIFPTIRTRKNK